MQRADWKRSGILLTLLAFIAAISSSHLVIAQAPAQRFVGTITAVAGDTLTVKTDSGESHQVQIPSSAVIKQLAPGQKDLSAAPTITLNDLAIGDRVLVKLDPNATGSTPQALQIIAMKKTDIAQQQQKEREDWQRNGAGGLVKSVDASSGAIVITSGVGPTAKTITVHTTPTTKLLRYAPDSVNFANAKPGTIDAIHVGDQLHVRGQKNADGTEITATDVVSGGFRNISGLITSVDPQASTLTVKDLATKKNVTVHVTPDAEMRRLPEMMARMIASALKGGNGSGGGAAGPHPEGGNGQAWSHAPGGQNGQAHRGPGGMEQALNRAPAVQLGDLKKGEAVMLVSTQGTSDVTAIKLLVGVEPLLESPDASRDLLANWSVGGGAGGEDAAQ